MHQHYENIFFNNLSWSHDIFFENWELQINIFQKSVFVHTSLMWNFNMISNFVLIRILKSSHIVHSNLHSRVFLTKKPRLLAGSLLARVRITVYAKRLIVNNISFLITRRIFALVFFFRYLSNQIGFWHCSFRSTQFYWYLLRWIVSWQPCISRPSYSVWNF